MMEGMMEIFSYIGMITVGIIFFFFLLPRFMKWLSRVTYRLKHRPKFKKGDTVEFHLKNNKDETQRGKISEMRLEKRYVDGLNKLRYIYTIDPIWESNGHYDQWNHPFNSREELIWYPKAIQREKDIDSLLD